MLKFQGSLEELQDIVLRSAIRGEWHFHKTSRFYRFQAATGAILNWWPKTGTINFQGHDAELFEALFLKHALVGATQSEGVRVCEESAWEAVPGPVQTQGGDPRSPKFCRDRRLPEFGFCSLFALGSETDQASRST